MINDHISISLLAVKAHLQLSGPPPGQEEITPAFALRRCGAGSRGVRSVAAAAGPRLPFSFHWWRGGPLIRGDGTRRRRAYLAI